MPAFSFIFAQIISLYPQLKDPNPDTAANAQNQINLWASAYSVLSFYYLAKLVVF
jgi:hypothetical protein